MYLAVINPIGLASSLDLLALPVWRLELRSVKWPGEDPETARKGLALGVAYVVNGTAAFAVICAINCEVHGTEIDPIAALGMEKATNHENKERLREALKVLFNVDLKKEVVEGICVKSGKLVDCYHEIIGAMWQSNTPLSGGVGPYARGELDGWRWGLLRERFSNWLIPGGASAPPPASLSISPTTGASATAGGNGVAGELAAARDPVGGLPGLPNLGGGTLGPPPGPPGTPKPRGKAKAAAAPEGMPSAPSTPPTEPPAGTPPASTAADE